MMHKKEKALGERALEWFDRIDDAIFDFEYHHLYWKKRDGLVYLHCPNDWIAYCKRYHPVVWMILMDLILPLIASVLGAALAGFLFNRWFSS